jgi:flagellar basal-body rod protein FlgB
MILRGETKARKASMSETLPIFSLLTQRMTWLSARQSVLAENVANADTPDFASRDLKEMDFGAALKDARVPAATHARHISPFSSAGIAIEPVRAAAQGGTVGGSQVSLEEEMVKLADTQVQYQTATNLYQKAVNMFRTALGGAR